MKNYTFRHGDSLELIKNIPDNSVDSVITDPPYGIAMMGRNWDKCLPDKQIWKECLRVVKPGGLLMCFGGTRTFHRLACHIEDAGWEIKDCFSWMYGCLSDDTKIMANGEWKHHTEINEGDLALCYDITTDELKWLPVQHKIVYEYEDTAYAIRSTETDQLVTGEHRCLVERNGSLSIETAENLAKESKVSMPVLEGMPKLLNSLRMSNFGDSTQKVVRQELSQNNRSDMCDMRQSVQKAKLLDQAMQKSLLQPSMQRYCEGRRLEASRTQGPCGLDRGQYEVVPGKDDRGEQSFMEGRRDLFQEEGQLHRSEVCAMSRTMEADGSQRWLYNGAPTCHGADDRATSVTERSCSSYRPQSIEQRSSQSTTLCVEQRSQAIRASQFSKTTLATIEPIEYKGVVWCVNVPTGSFVAMRNGKSFITGNSGFPKSMSISKAISKAKRGFPQGGPDPESPNAGRFKSGCSADSPEGRHHGAGPGAFMKEQGVKDERELCDEARVWDGYGTALKPAWEPVIFAMKPTDGTYVENVEKWGVAGINIDRTRIATSDNLNGGAYAQSGEERYNGYDDWRFKRSGGAGEYQQPSGRFPANVLLSHHPDCEHLGHKKIKAITGGGGEKKPGKHLDGTKGVYGKFDGHVYEGTLGYGDSDGNETVEHWNCHADCPVKILDEQTADLKGGTYVGRNRNAEETANQIYGKFNKDTKDAGFGDSGGASRFFYCGKASRSERNRGCEHLYWLKGKETFTLIDEETYNNTPESDRMHGNIHVTVKPLALMKYLCKMVKMPGETTVLDPFCGSGTTGVAALLEGLKFIGFDKDPMAAVVAEARLQQITKEMNNGKQN